jgi:hypothetical protein
MTIEMAFEMRASPREIYAALERDLASASEYEGSTHEVMLREPYERLKLRVTIGIVPCVLEYRISPRGENTEVSATVTPYGWRYAMFQIVTLGMRRSFFEVALFETLTNLKAAVEDETDASSVRDG